MAAIYYVAFGLVCIVHALELIHITYKVKNPRMEKKKIIVVFIILSVSYLSRAILNTI